MPLLAPTIRVRLSTCLLAVALGAACTSGEREPAEAAQAGAVAGTLYHGGDILTMEGHAPEYAEAVVVDDGMISYVGPLAGARNMHGPFAEEVDLAGRTLLPGFIDPHGHVSNVGVQALSANLLPAPDGDGNSFDQLVEITRNWMKTDDGQLFMEKTGWVLGFGYDDSQLEEKEHPPAEVLDRISTEYPVYFIHQSGHLGAMNTRAIELVGFNADTQDPDGGIIRRRDNGEPSGVLEEMAHFMVVFEVFGQFDKELQDIGLQRGQEIYASFGYTTAQDGRVLASNTEALERASEQDSLLIDIVAYPDIAGHHDAIPSNYYGPEYTNKYRIGGYKINLDGSPQGKTAWLTECYYVNPAGQTGCYTGYPTMSDEQVAAYVAEAMERDIQILAHVNGDAAIDQFIRAVRKANEAFGRSDRRPVGIHSQTIREDQLDDFLAEGIFPAFFPMHTFYWGDWHASSVLGPERAARISPTWTAREKGLRFTTHHDAPVALPSSIRVLDATVNRMSRSGQVIGPDERVSPYVALKAMTDWAAFQHFEEDRKGTLTPGKVADFVILDRNPVEIPPGELADLRVVETVFRGETIYRR
jgi:predicted amidohydrolase YtcJ